MQKFISLSAGPGTDMVRGSGGDDTIMGSTGSDGLYGGNGNDFLTEQGTGSAGDLNDMCGNDGADTLIGGAFAYNRMDGNLPGSHYDDDDDEIGDADGDVDTLIGPGGSSTLNDFEYQASEDGVQLGEGSFPLPTMISCG